MGAGLRPFNVNVNVNLKGKWNVGKSIFSASKVESHDLCVCACMPVHTWMRVCEREREKQADRQKSWPVHSQCLSNKWDKMAEVAVIHSRM